MVKTSLWLQFCFLWLLAAALIHGFVAVNASEPALVMATMEMAAPMATVAAVMAEGATNA